MMIAIVSSQTIDVSPQADGRRYVTETHTADTGEVYQRTFLADADLDLYAARAQYAINLADMLNADG